MSDYISREAAIELGYWHGEKPTADNPFPDGVDAVDTVDIENLPAADVRENKRGRWIQDDETGVPICSVCFSGKPTRCVCSSVIESEIRDREIRFCYFCGADMREEQT